MSLISTSVWCGARPGRPPADVHAHPFGRQIAHRVIERDDVDGNDFAVIGEGQIRDRPCGAAWRGPGNRADTPASTIALYSRRITLLGERVNVFLVALVVAVLQVARDLPGRGRGHETVFRFGAGERGLGGVDVGLRRRPVLPVDGAGAGGAMLERRGELLEQQRQLGNSSSPVPIGGALSPS